MSSRHILSAALAPLAALFLALASAAPAGAAPEAPRTGLIVGNSFSYYNCGVGTFLRGMTKAAQRPWTARMVTISAGRLAWHDLDAYMRDRPLDTYLPKDGRSKFDVVFLQGQSAEPITAKDGADQVYREAVAAATRVIRQHGGRPVLVATWARRDAPDDAERLYQATAAAARANGADVLPVGLAFQRARAERPELELYHADGRHPSAAGSYLYAAMLYSWLFQASPEGLPFSGGCGVQLSEDEARFLQGVAWRVSGEQRGR